MQTRIAPRVEKNPELTAWALTFLLALTAGSCHREASPESRTHDFGTIVGDHRLGHRFSLRNDSGYPWIVQGTTVSCTCLEVLTTRKEVASGEDLQVDCTLDTTNTSGELDRHIAVRIEVNGQPRVLDFYTTAFVKGPPVVSPSRIQHEAPPGEEKFEVSAELMIPTEDRGARVELDPDSSLEGVRVVVESLRRRGRAQYATVRVDGSLAKRRSRAFEVLLAVAYDGSSRKVVIPAIILAGSAFRVSPAAIIMARNGAEPARSEIATAVRPGFTLQSVSLVPAESGNCRFELPGQASARIFLEVPPDRTPTRLVLTGSRGETESVPVRILEP